MGRWGHSFDDGLISDLSPCLEQVDAAFRTASFAHADASRLAGAAAAAAVLGDVGWHDGFGESGARLRHGVTGTDPDVLKPCAFQLNATGVEQGSSEERHHGAPAVATDASHRGVAPGPLRHGGAVWHPPAALVYIAAIFSTLAIYVAFLVRRTRKADAEAPELQQPEAVICV